MTTFSIVITTKDRPTLLRRAVRSALANLGEMGELIVVDDHSVLPALTSLAGYEVTQLAVVPLPVGQSGISAARNAGLAAARGDIIFFLDDDDILAEGYCDHVLSRAVERCDYGFSAYHQVGSQSDTRVRVRFKEGPIANDAPLRKRVCGFGMGFWIKRSAAAEAGPVCTDLSINEDTDYVCRLITLGKTAWYTATPSVTVFSAHQSEIDSPNTTRSTSADERARCMRIVCERFPNLIELLGASYVRHCAKTGATREAREFIQRQSGWATRHYLTCLLWSKATLYRLSTARNVRRA